jgi:DNA invertase Pin-like site-specific DNA recombinase
MGKIYAYHRFSTDEQDAQSQRNIISKYAESKGLQIDEIISDEGISGSVSYKKRNLSELLSKTNKGDTIIVSEVSRLTRGGIIELSDMIAEFFAPKGLRLIISNVNLDIDCSDMNPLIELQLSMMATFAKIERLNIKNRTKAALDARKKQIKQDGYFISKAGNKCTSLGGTTTGQTKGGKANGEKRRKEAMNDEKNNMIAAMLEGCNTPQDIDKVVERLNARGILTKTGLPFTRNRLTALRTKINRRAEYAQSNLSA